MKRWRRPLILIALLLLAGAVVNVAVAWGIATWAPEPDGRTSWSSAAPSWYRAVEQPSERASGWPPVADDDVWMEELGVGARAAWRHLPSGASVRVAQTCAFGYPALSMSRSFVWSSGPSVNSHRWFAAAAGRPPLTPLPRGLLLNTLFYAGILALPLSFFPIRRRLRTRRGRCPKCGYDRTGLADPAAPCPECGATR